MRVEALGDRLARDLEIRVHAIQADVEENAPGAGLDELVPDAVALVQKRVATPVIDVGDDIPRLQQGEHLPKRRHPRGDMHHQGQPHPIGHFLGASERGERAEAGIHPHLHARDEIAILLDHLDGGCTVEEPLVVVLADLVSVDPHRLQTDGRDVQKGQDTRGGRSDDVLTEAEEAERSAAPRIHKGGRAGGWRQRVGIDAEDMAAEVAVQVKIHQAGTHQPAGGIEHLPAGRRIERLADPFDPPAHQEYIAPAKSPLLDVQQEAVLYQQRTRLTVHMPPT